ncbi:MAG TPA: hypothetical protein VFG50_01315 [Rhodothermales bacterium]|nr:hypothetical protein [Rhodothermales bacterium]
MLRVFIILIAFLAVALAIILEQPLFYPIAAILFVGIVGMALGRLFRRSRPEESPRNTSEKSTRDDLMADGIMEIRPKGAPPTRPDTADPDEADVSTARPAGPAKPAEKGPAQRMYGVSAPTVHIKTVADAHATDERLKKDMLVPFLHAVQAAIGATTVCLLKLTETANRYNIEALVSKNAYARGHGQFTAKQALLPPKKKRKRVNLLRVGEKGLATKNLGYYLEPIAVRQIALAPVPHQNGDLEFILAADTMEEGGLGTRRQRELLAQFAGVLGTILDTRDTSNEEDLEETETEPEQPRPRREIIAEEMRHARAESLPLSLALVHLNRAESIAESGPEAVLDVEGQLETYLNKQTEETEAFRVERFGELTFGAFYRGGVDDVQDWALDLQQNLSEESGLLEGGVSIGIAVMADHHDGPDALRADATEALREAYESGSCTIIG